MVKIFVQGDIILLDFTPQAGHEQRGKRPALVVSNNTFNKFTKTVIVCPITSTIRNIPVQIELDERTKTQGVIMCEQVKCLDANARKAHFLEKLPADMLENVVDMVYSFIEM